MSDDDRPPSRDPAASARPHPDLDPGERARRDARIRSLEQVYMRRGMIFVVVATILFVVGVWAMQKMVSERVPTGPPKPKDVTHALRGLYNAAYADGIRMYESAGAADLARWLAEKVGPHAKLPDLRDAGLFPTGVRTLNIGKGWGMIQYRDPGGAAGDVLAVVAPRDRVRVAPDATAHPTDGRDLWVLSDGGMSFAWVEGAGADWVLVSTRDEARMLAAGRALLLQSN